jgi:hypothetical protein
MGTKLHHILLSFLVSSLLVFSGTALAVENLFSNLSDDIIQPMGVLTIQEQQDIKTNATERNNITSPLFFILGGTITEKSDSAAIFGLELNDDKGEVMSKDMNDTDDHTSKCKGMDGKSRWFSQILPNTDINTGGKDAFDSITFHVAGNLVNATCKENDAIQTAELGKIEVDDTWDPTKPINGIQFSAGVETTQRLESANFLAEVGYVPVMNAIQIGKHDIIDDYIIGIPFYLLEKIGFEEARLGKTVNLSAFVQGGFKSKIDGALTPATTPGGDVDQSKEKTGEEIFRLKAKASTELNFTAPYLPGLIDELKNLINKFWTDPENKLGKDDYPIKFVASATGWSDLKNGAFYHNVKTGVEFHLAKNKMVDFLYENGSGAPNFNEGDQFTAKLKFQY